MKTDLVLLLGFYVGLGLLASLLAAVSRLPAVAKLMVIALVGASYFVCWQSWRDVTGWPAEVPLPRHFLFHAATIEAPDEHGGHPGALMLWVTTLTRDGPEGPPRAYRIPYRRSLHEQVQLAMDRMREGHPQVGSLDDAVDGETGRGRGMFSPEEPAPGFELRTLPAPALPEK